MSESNVQDMNKIEQFFELNKIKDPDYQKQIRKTTFKIDELYVGSIIELGEKGTKSGVMKNGEGKAFPFGRNLTQNDRDAIIAYNFVKGFGDGKVKPNPLNVKTNINPNINRNNPKEKSR